MNGENLSLGIDFLRPGQPDASARGLESLAPSIDLPAFADVSRARAAQRADDLLAAGATPRDLFAGEGDVDGLEVVIGEVNFLPAWFLSVGARTAAAVCKIEASGVNYQGVSGSWSGTGFLVSPNILLTNNHVLNSADVARAATCIFNFQAERDGAIAATRGYRLDADRLFITSPARGGLDFTFVWVKDEPGAEFGWVSLDRNAFTIVDREYVNVIQHPSGRPKTLVLQDNRVRRQDETTVHYTSDTEPGSSGSCVFNNLWTPVALHHASRPAPAEEAAAGFKYLNEGIKFSAIATYLEQVAQEGGADAGAARDALGVIAGSDALLGFFGSLGRQVASPATDPLETVVTSYRGELQDVDVAFWNVEWLTRRLEKVPAVAQVMKDMNLDVWALVESSPESAQAIVDELARKHGMEFGMAASDPKAASGIQSTTVIWNKRTVSGKTEEWPADIAKWFTVHSTQFDQLGLEAVEGKVFPRRPGLFHFTAVREGDAPSFDFYLVPLHLKAMDEGSKRRRMAAAILGAAVKKMIAEHGKDADWVLGGDYNAQLASQDFAALLKNDMVAISAEDEGQGAFSYLKRPKSLIDHIFLSANLAKTYGADDYIIVAAEKSIPKYVKQLSDHRPVLVRLSLKQAEPEPPGAGAALPPDLANLLGQIDAGPLG
ncbi:MAG: trypsin-like peptidase domain-containing protein [Anaerolineae bacterium]|nr:trypsin-like peptidase domain-containing protein [Anaerolineae bacterium]